MSGLLIFLLSVLSGYLFFLYLSHPDKKKDKLPHFKIGNVEMLPNFKIHIKSKTYHIHHWLVLSLVILLALTTYEGVNHFTLLKGAAIGGILQGLQYPDRFQFRHPRKKPETV